MNERIIAIGDIHGYSAALAAILDAVQPRPLDTVVVLGDVIDRGPDSPGVVEQLMGLAYHCRLVPILGNHEEVVLELLLGQYYLLDRWMAIGGQATLAAYGCEFPDEIPLPHLEFLRSFAPWYETPRHFFVHASYDPGKKLPKQPADLLRWASLAAGLPGPHRSGKVAIVGHTAQRSGEILDVGYLKCIDTCIYGGGWLTALDVTSGDVWQADQRGRLREPEPREAWGEPRS